MERDLLGKEPSPEEIVTPRQPQSPVTMTILISELDIEMIGLTKEPTS
jgi:hypothetical protein